MREVVGEPAVLVGNSLGGYNALHTAALQPDIARRVLHTALLGLLGLLGLRSGGTAWLECTWLQPSS